MDPTLSPVSQRTVTSTHSVSGAAKVIKDHRTRGEARAEDASASTGSE